MPFKKGNIPWMKGRVASEEHRRRMSVAQKGRHHTDEAKQKISESAKGNTRWLGKHHTEETKRKIGAVHKGKIISEEIKQKIREKRKQQVMKPCSEEMRRERSERNRGDKSHFWKGGIAPENERIRQGIEFRLWREAVFARDNWTCQDCGLRSGNGEKVTLNAHHIKGFAKYPDLRFAIDNGITLCVKCHNKKRNELN
jgi:5-methylcytosine-specific restriction endonuclease McrA